MTTVKFIKLTQTGLKMGEAQSAVWVNFATVKSFFPHADKHGSETVLRFVDDTSIGVQEEATLIEKWIKE